MRSDQTPSARRYWVALILLFAGALVGYWHNRTTASGRTDALSGFAQTIVSPPARALHGVTRWFGDQTGWLFRGRSLAAENQRLREHMDDLERKNAELTELAGRYDQLRDDLGFVKSINPPPLAADVVARHVNPDFDTIVISRGKRDGVHVDSVVRTRKGLVGKVSEVSYLTATVILLTDPNGAVGARVQRDGSRNQSKEPVLAIGVCKGDHSSLIPLIDLPYDADIRPGDLVVTSGFGRPQSESTKGDSRPHPIYPRGLPIGTVVSVKEEEGSVGKVAKLHPVVDLDRLEEVYVLP